MSIGRSRDFKNIGGGGAIFLMESISLKKNKFAKSMEMGMRNMRNGSYDLTKQNYDQNPFSTSRMRMSGLQKNNSVSFKTGPVCSNNQLSVRNNFVTIEKKNLKSSKRFTNFLNFIITPDKLGKRGEWRAHKSVNYKKTQKSSLRNSKMVERTCNPLQTSKKTVKNRKRKKSKNLKKCSSSSNYVKVNTMFGKKRKPRSKNGNLSAIPYTNFFYSNNNDMSMVEGTKEDNKFQKEIEDDFETLRERNRLLGKENVEDRANESITCKKSKRHFFNVKTLEMYKQMVKNPNKNFSKGKLSFLDFINNPSMTAKRSALLKNESKKIEEERLKRKSWIKANLKKCTISKKKNGYIYSYGVNSFLNNFEENPEQQSQSLKRITIYFNKIKTNIKRMKAKFSFFGLYQGKGTAKCADFFKNNLHKFIVGNPHLCSDVFKAIRSGVHRCQKLYFDHLSKEEAKIESSCSALLVITIGKSYF